MGEETNWTPGYDTMKTPRGILNYALAGHPQTDPNDLAWKLTGNLGGEDYRDHARGPLNEGALYAERQGYHLPRSPLFLSDADANANSTLWPAVVAPRNPITEGVNGAGVGFFATTFALAVPSGWDVPLAFVFANGSAEAKSYRVQLFVNGYQFGKYSKCFF